MMTEIQPAPGRAGRVLCWRPGASLRVPDSSLKNWAVTAHFRTSDHGTSL